MTPTTGEQRHKSRKWDVKYLLEDLWSVDTDDTFCKIFTKEAKKGIQNLLLYYYLYKKKIQVSP